MIMVELVIVFLTFWFIAGAGAYLLGQAESVADGMKKTASGLINFVRSNSGTVNQVFQVSENEFDELTTMLSQFFSFLIFECANQNNDFLQVTYRCGQCKADRSIIDAVFQKFLRDYFNMPAGTPLSTYVHLAGGHLVLVYGFSQKGAKWVQEQSANQKSRQIPQGKDLTE